MEKSKLGIRLWVYAALAFVLAALGQTLLCGLLCGLAVVAEKSRWLNRQMIQAFALILTSAAISTVLGLLNPINSIPFVGLVFSKIVSTVNSLIDLLDRDGEELGMKIHTMHEDIFDAMHKI